MKERRSGLRSTKLKIALSLGLIVLLVPFLWPERAGIDIFAPAGRPVVASVPGVVIFRGVLGIGGNVVAVLGPKWRIHYFVLQLIPQVWKATRGTQGWKRMFFVDPGEVISGAQT